MQTVSKNYKKSMKRIGRNRGYIKITLGIVNTEAQENLRVAKDNELAYFSENEIAQTNENIKQYATCEKDFSRLDGTMFFAPLNAETPLYKNGLVSDRLCGEIKFTFNNDNVYDVAGFTIDFSDNYPIDFTISNGVDTLTFTDNDKRYFTTDLGLHNIKELTIRATKMLNDGLRLRVFSLSMGVSNTFTNDNTISYSETTYVSAISDSLPSKDTTITVANYEQYYNPDNDASVLAFFEVGQEVKVQFGYDVDGDGVIEWLPETITHLKSWSATDKDATFKTSDVFDYMSGTYDKGVYSKEGISLYDLAVDVFSDADVTDYKIDSYLKKVIVHNPMPNVPHTQALQIIANAGRSTLREDRDGKIYLESAFIPKYYATCNGEAIISNVANIIKDTDKIAYALSSMDFSLLSDDRLLYYGEDSSTENVGYVSDMIADENGEFETNPEININLESNYSPSGFSLRFRNVAPLEFKVKTYVDETLVDEFVVENPEIDCNVEHTFVDFNKMVLEFTKAKPHARITVDKFMFGSPTDYTIERNMMLSSPNVTRDEKVRALSISMYDYKEVDDVKTISSMTIGNPSVDNEYAFTLAKPSYDYEIIADGGNVEILYESAYTVAFKVKTLTKDTLKVELKGKEYQVSESQYIEEHNLNGTLRTWENPLISNIEQAKTLEGWLADYFLGNIEYEIEWRSDPRIDTNDLFYLELKDGTMANIRSYQQTLDFNGAWRGSLKARKVIV